MKKTLMWYDEIDLFRPAAVNPENGYRCYNYHQSPLLETILLLRELEVPIQAIQDYIKNRSAENLKDLLDEKIADLDLKITHLQAVRETLCTHHDYSKLFIEIPLLTYQKGLHMSPGGRYLRAFHKGNLDRMPKRYEEIFAFADKNNLTLCGFSYGMGINENVIDRIEDYMPSPLNGYTHLLFNGDIYVLKTFTCLFWRINPSNRLFTYSFDIFDYLPCAGFTFM